MIVKICTMKAMRPVLCAAAACSCFSAAVHTTHGHTTSIPGTPVHAHVDGPPCSSTPVHVDGPPCLRYTIDVFILNHYSIKNTFSYYVLLNTRWLVFHSTVAVAIYRMICYIALHSFF